MNSDIKKLIDNRAVIITPTQRLSRHLRHSYATEKLAKGVRAWRTPDCLPWAAWCKRNFAALMLRQKENLTLLNTLQQQCLWQKIIQDSKYKNQLLQISATAKQVANAYQLTKEWCIPVFPESIYLTEDAYAFKSWVLAYEEQKTQRGWLDVAELPDYINQNFEKLKPLFNSVAFYDFDQLTRQQVNFKKKLLAAGIAVHEVNIKQQNNSVSVSSYKNNQDEIIAAACWAKNRLQEDQTASIGVIVPNLTTIRDKLEHGFMSVFFPQKYISPHAALKKPYVISLGKPLLDYPVIYTAINLLSLAKYSVSSNVLTSLLHSPFITGMENEGATRSQFDALLKQMGEHRINLKMLDWIAEKKARSYQRPEQFLQFCKNFFSSFQEYTKKKTFYSWAISFSECLSCFGWPGTRGLNSDEQQLMTAWQNVLSQFTSLDSVSEPVGFNLAFSQLNRLLSETRFQPETPELPIQILGVTGSAGMQFDHLWVMGMQDDNWPPTLPMNAFIPNTLQRQFEVPTANVNFQFELAKELTDKLIKSAKESVFSHITQDADRVCRVSPLIKHIDAAYNDNIGFEDYKQLVFASSAMEKFIDDNVNAISTSEIITGSTGLFKDQAACPFKAFARYRLNAKALQHVEIGLSPAERGTLAHRAMHYLWKELKTSTYLNNKKDTELVELIRTVVSDAIKRELSQQSAFGLNRKLIMLEQQRLEYLLNQWVEIEKQRNRFEVIVTEGEKKLIFEGIALHLRVDRIDQLEDGRCIILDYKTGAVNKNDWESDKPNDPQLPLYAIVHEQSVAAIAFASLKLGKLGFVGQGEDENILPAVGVDKYFSWSEKLTTWKTVLVTLANDFKQGVASVTPTKMACHYCELKPLCRIDERMKTIDLLENDNV